MCDSEQTIYSFVWREPYKPRLSTVTVFWQDPTHVLVYQCGGLVLLFLNGPWTTFEECATFFFFATFQHERRLEGQDILLHFLGKKTATMYNLIWGGYPLQRDKKQRQLLHEAGKTIVPCNLKLPLEDSKIDFENMFRNLQTHNTIYPILLATQHNWSPRCCH